MMKRLVILGGGESGTGTAVLGKKLGFDVFLSDSGKLKELYVQELTAHGIPYEEGGHTESLILNASEVVKSPGIPNTAPLIEKLISMQIPVLSELEFAARYTEAKLIAITGSNGKTTTTLLTYHILKQAGLNVGLGGNVGKSFARQVAECSFDYYVLEISSFQLDNMYAFKADIAIITNITPDHLDRYEYKLEKYAQSKFRIIQNQTKSDVFIYNADDAITMETMKGYSPEARMFPISLKPNQHFEFGGFIQNENLILNTNPNQSFSMKITELALQGKHNLQNSMAASAAARFLELRKEVVRESLTNFENIEHRLEFVASVHGIRFINDSKATNVNSTWYALESVERPIVWIAGGTDKGNDYSELLELVQSKVKAIVCLTKDSSKIRKAFAGVVDTIIDADSADQAVRISYDLGRDGDTVLLSPACASFDLFENYEDRGRQFKMAVKKL
jgi:UDP-N-acetylmuramoylalanine--D-glutamate ligase